MLTSFHSFIFFPEIFLASKYQQCFRSQTNLFDYLMNQCIQFTLKAIPWISFNGIHYDDELDSFFLIFKEMLNSVPLT